MRCSHCREININLVEEDCVAANFVSGIPKARSMAGRKWENSFLREKLEKVDRAITFSC